MARRWAKALVRKFEAMQDSRWLRPFAHLIAHPSLWSLNRRSVALAVAAGMIGGLIPGPFQMITAGLIAFYRRQLGCVTGDMLGAMIEVTEAGLFLVAATGGGA